MFRASMILCAVLAILGLSAALERANDDWYKNILVYQIYPRSFVDSDGDGIGDLNGIISRLEHIADIGVGAFWLSPIYTSPQADFGYDIANFTDIDPDYGTLADFDKLVAKARSLGLKVILDFVPNHSSDKHEWFRKSIRRIKPYDVYYVWRDAKIVNGARQPPNNWLSTFRGSAWEWNSVRRQYYLHQFAKGQPDLNYRNPSLNQAMKDVLTFWMNRGVDGFRIDAINCMFEDSKLRDEPRLNRTDVPNDDYDSLDHIYTKNLNETYAVLRQWRQLMDDHAKKHKRAAMLILTESDSTPDLTTKFYQSGSNAPFNFMFIADLKNHSSALDFKRFIDRWMNNIPSGDHVANWVVGNHDNHRAASRFGVQRADQLSMLATVLPGISVIYNGDEIGMVDRPFTYAETVDPLGCNVGPERYHLKSRDPERTPFQWDNTTSAGFSKNPRTWLPVHGNYKTLNLAAQKAAYVSHYRVFKALMSLKNKPIIAQGSLETILATEKVLAVVRRLGSSTVALLVNFSESPVRLDARSWLNIPEDMFVYVASVHSGVPAGRFVDTTAYTVPGAASIVLVTPDLLH